MNTRFKNEKTSVSLHIVLDKDSGLNDRLTEYLYNLIGVGGPINRTWSTAFLITEIERHLTRKLNK